MLRMVPSHRLSCPKGQHFSLLRNTRPNPWLAGHWKCPCLQGPVQILCGPQKPGLATGGDQCVFRGCHHNVPYPLLRVNDPLSPVWRQLRAFLFPLPPPQHDVVRAVLLPDICSLLDPGSHQLTEAQLTYTRCTHPTCATH